MSKKFLVLFLICGLISLISGCANVEITVSSISSNTTSKETTYTTIQTSSETSSTDTNNDVFCENGYSPFEGKCVSDDELSPFERTYTLEEVTEDFNQMITALNINNPLLFGNQADINDLVERQRLKLENNMTIYEFYRILSPIAIAYKCGHTVLNLDYETYLYTYDNAVFFPLDVRVIDSEIVVIGNNESYDIPLGSKIVMINDMYSDRILEELLAYVPADGDSVNGRYAKINQRFSMTYFYVYPSETFKLMYREPDSISYKYITVNAEKMSSITANNDFEQVNVSPYSSLFYQNYAILTIKSFAAYGEYSNQDFYSFFLDFFTDLKESGIENLIIDIRENWGGDPLIASDLFSYIAMYSQPYFSEDSPNYYPRLSSAVPLSEPHFSGNIYVLIDGITFSTAGHFAALVKHQDIATFIGSETSGSYAVSDSHVEIRLSNTNLQLYTSKEIWKVEVDGLPIGRGVMPDFEVYQSWEDYVDKTDNVLEYTINLIGND